MFEIIVDSAANIPADLVKKFKNQGAFICKPRKWKRSYMF